MDIYKKILTEIGDEEKYSNLFFESTATLLSNLIRGHVYDNLNTYSNFYDKFESNSFRTP